MKIILRPTSIIVIRSIVLYFTLWFFRNCLIGQGYTVKISDFAMFRPGYSSDYFKASENSNEISSSTRMSSEPIQEDLIPLRWIPWEVYIMVRTKILYIYIHTYIYIYQLWYMYPNITYSVFKKSLSASLVDKKWCMGFRNHHVGVVFIMSRGSSFVRSNGSTNHRKSSTLVSLRWLSLDPIEAFSIWSLYKGDFWFNQTMLESGARRQTKIFGNISVFPE